MVPAKLDRQKLNAIIEAHRGEKWGLIPLLQAVQEEFGYVPPESIEAIAEAMNVFPSQVQGVITFYAGFALEPKGKYILRVCRGTACHVKGGHNIIDVISQTLGIEEGGTTPDKKFTFETVACLGTCFLAPVMMVNDDYHGHLTAETVREILERY